MLKAKFQKIIFILLVFFLIIYTIQYSKNYFSVDKFAIEKTHQIENYLIDEEKLKNSNSQQIFFLETYLDSVRSIDNPRQVCSIEAAARMNPDMEIYFYFFTNSTSLVLKYTKFLNILHSYSNIKIRYVNILEFINGTKIENFFKTDRVGKSPYRIEHTSDILRLLVLYKFGGLYLDLDVVSFYPVKLINKRNFICLEGDNLFANCILKFDREDGKKYIESYFDQLEKTYNPDAWTGIGNTLISQVFLTFCNSTELHNNKFGKCDKITALPTDKCFAIMYGSFKNFYEENSKDEVLDKIFQSGSFFIHIWNKMLTFDNQTYKINHQSKSAYAQIAKVYCPKTFEVADVF
ncbi:hypothetical protein PVAND_015831 [Polypedilum vanderplanki]|uniref:Alpha 1,4-glycosyltransferase domain-containing protein n=1 Tax=Polypedilum vanderplanki TaxID=319348 RepID=A0A9J6BEA6_POLVA|nr:hypothetical protein PVAND_015831 [Polypedilum vanderplanki]